MTPDQYRREGAEAMRAYIANDCDPAHLSRSDNPTEFYAGYRYATIQRFTAIRAIDPDEVLAKVAWRGPGEIAHRYSPDWMAQGDCQICGHTQEAHQPAPDPVARLVEAANQARLAFAGYVSAQSAINRLDEALAAMETNHD